MEIGAHQEPVRDFESMIVSLSCSLLPLPFNDGLPNMQGFHLSRFLRCINALAAYCHFSLIPAVPNKGSFGQASNTARSHVLLLVYFALRNIRFRLRASQLVV
jgi:hypothetical protein